MVRMGRPHGRHDDAGSRLIDAAVALLAERGPAGFSLREAARRADVSHAAPGYLFGDVRGLLTRVALQSNDRLTAAMERARRRHSGDPSAALRAIGRAYVRFALQRPAEFRNLFGDAIDADDPAIAHARIEGGTPLIRALGELHPEADPDSPAFAGRLLLAWASVHGVAALAVNERIPGGRGATRAVVEQVLDEVVAALTTPLPQPPTEDTP